MEENSFTKIDIPENIGESVFLTAESSAYLLEHIYRLIFKSLWKQPGSASDVAADLGLELRQVYFRIRRLHDAGLLTIIREDKIPGKQGRPTKIYAPTYQQVILPFSQTPAATLGELVLGQIKEQQEIGSQYLLEHLTNGNGNGEEAVLVMSYQDGMVKVDTRLPEPQQDDSVVEWRPMQLDPASVRQLYEEIMGLLMKYRQEAPPENLRTYQCGIQLVKKP